MTACGASAGRGLIVGVDDDTAKWIGRPNGLVGVERALGVDAVRITLDWRGQTRPTKLQQVYLHRIALTLALGQRVVLAVYGTANAAPLDDVARARYCDFVAHVLRRLPAIHDVVIWNEANNAYFWPASAGAAAYEALLADAWDRVHALRRNVNVIDSTAPHQDPAAFIAGLGTAYRTSGRTQPILDTYGHNAYPELSSEPVDARHDNGSLDEGDYDKLVHAFDAAFAGTGQPLPGENGATIWYLEDGFQTTVPEERRSAYRGVENVRSVVAPTQASQLAAAVELAYCQPYVGAFFNFELLDERRLAGWQSGVLWSDGTRKPAYDAFREAIAAVHSGKVDCPGQ